MTNNDTSGRMTGDQLASARKTLRLSQDELAQRLSVRRDTLARWETGRDPIPYAVPGEVQGIAAARIEEIQASFLPACGERVHLSDDPTPLELAAIVRAGGAGWRSAASNIARSDTLTVQRVLDSRLDTHTAIDPGVIASLTADRDTVKIVWATYTYTNVYGARSGSVTVMEVTSGLYVHQYILPGNTSEEDALTLARLASVVALPTPGASWEM